MTIDSRLTTRTFLRATTAIAALAIASAAAAQAGPTPLGAAAVTATNADPDDAPEIIVTGSALPTTPDQVAVPVSIIGADAIAKGGVNNNVLELVRKQIPSFAGRSNAGNSNANNTNQNTISTRWC